ncbi:uncharacterized protein LOC143030471 [Oratosquilla oratoria]|uniref:uncharacterized protein LOC143030471 n=1 Tax=Oratosquilla oratoria TaxID=337810 RepID=UPI003F76AF98
MIGLIRRVFSYLSPSMFKPLYTTFVRTHLEYAQSAWSPRYRSLETKIEQVQQRATSLVDGFGQMTYSDRLKYLDLPTLKYRRLRGDMIEMWKHFNIYQREILPASFRPTVRPSRLHSKQLFRHRPNDGMYGAHHNSFYHRVARIWNGLPSEVVDAGTVSSFKNRLDCHWRDFKLRFDPSATPPEQQAIV